MQPTWILPLADPSATLETVGGKGLSLARMAGAGLPVPNGFHITTLAYRHFIAENDLQPRILAALQAVDVAQPATLEAAAQAIAEIFARAGMSPETGEEIRAAYAGLCHAGEKELAVAVRSSATAEDLPEASFAGQQETYLNIVGSPAVLAAVKKCWASLWSARAIAYRINHHIDPNDVVMAVVIQEMVDAHAAGVLFTANPLNGRRDEMIINATWGLGQAIVGGLVSPDTIVVDKTTGATKRVDVAQKTVITVATDTGAAEVPLTDARRSAPVLKASQVTQLVKIASQIENFYGQPQDIEWCCREDIVYIVQSRAITALPEWTVPAPTAWKLPRGAYALMRNNIVELMADPLSPLFATLGCAAINTSLQRWMNEEFAMRGIMPPEIILVINHYAYNNGSVSAKSMLRLLWGAGQITRKMFTGAVERWTESGRPRYFNIVAEWQAKDWRAFSTVELLESARHLTEVAIDAYGALIAGVIPAAWITEALFTALYNRLIKRRDDPSAPTYLLGYDSLPIRADQALYRLAEWVRQQPALAQSLENTPTARWLEPDALAQVPETLQQEWRARLQQHLHDFGHMLYDLDFMHPVPADDPAPVLNALKLYLRGQGINPTVRQRELAERREQAVLAMRGRLKGQRLKWFNRYLASAQKYAPLREDGLAEIGLAYPLIRALLRETGRRFALRQIIPTADDIFWLTQDEVFQTATRLDAGLPGEPLAEKIPLRKAEHRAALSVHPPMALPQMKLFGFDLMSLKAKRGRGGKGNVIKGVAASPGQATGNACVLHGPEDFDRMKPGDVLVAPITTPAWTPLFALAAAIVTDVGGPLSHGSIVAREYGIPAVLGTGNATRRIQAGQVITVDGSTGTVTLKAA